MTYNIYLITLSENSKHAQFFTLSSDIMGEQGGDWSEAHMPRALAGVRETLPHKHDGIQSWVPKSYPPTSTCVSKHKNTYMK